MKVLQGFKEYYDPAKYLLLLKKTIYGLKQAAMTFWKKILQCFYFMGYEKSKADLCLYCKWTIDGLVALIT